MSAALITDENLPVRFINFAHLTGRTDSDVVLMDTRANVNNVIRVLTRDVINNFENIRSLLLNNASIEQITFDAFQRCNNLQVIQLRGNRIWHLFNGVFRNCRNVNFLTLESNELRALNRETFNGLNALDILSLSDNSIYNLPNDVFAHLTNLQLLQLQNNYIQTLTATILAPLQNLEFFICSNCELGEIHQNAFSSNLRLMQLDLSHNYLSSLADGVFSNLTSLRFLTLGFNRFQRLGRAPFGYHLHMNDINLQGAQLYAIEPRFLLNFPNLINIDLRENYCANESVSNVTFIDFNVDPLLNECFFNWFNPSSGGVSIGGWKSLILLFIAIIFMN